MTEAAANPVAWDFNICIKAETLNKLQEQGDLVYFIKEFPVDAQEEFYTRYYNHIIRNSKEKFVKHGFDLTGFGSADKWRNVMEVLGITRSRKHYQYREEAKKGDKWAIENIENPYYNNSHWYHWGSLRNGLLIETKANPLTGRMHEWDYAYESAKEKGISRPRTIEKGYASYLELTGTPELVAKAIRLIHEFTENIKGECIDSHW